MNKSEMIEAVASEAGLDKRQAEAAIGAFVDSVVATTKSGEAVSIFGFGTFKPTARAARKGRNPQTGAPVKIAASKGVKFQPATAFKSVLNTRGTAKKTTAKKTTTVAKKSSTTKAASATKTAATKATKAVASSAATAAKAIKAATSIPPAKPATAKRTTTTRTTTTRKAAPATRTPAAKRVTASAKKPAGAVKKR